MEFVNIKLKIDPITKGHLDTVVVLTLNRPQAANSLSADMIDELITALGLVAGQESCRCLVIKGGGKHFSAGADIHWMQQAAALSYEENIQDAQKLVGLFEGLYRLSIPTIAAVQGAVFGGAVGMVACCDVVVAREDSRFCLSETRLGILPAVIMPYLARRMLPGALRRCSLSAREFWADEAKAFGLVDVVSDENSFAATIRNELNQLLLSGPEAQRALKALHQSLVDNSLQQSDKTLQAIAKARTGPEGQQGLKAFLAKEKTPWTAQLGPEWTMDEA
jgi:methylglutaconyl-CoA hydratase